MQRVIVRFVGKPQGPPKPSHDDDDDDEGDVLRKHMDP